LEAKQARELDPLSLGTNATVALTLYHARRFDEAIERAPTVMELSKQWGHLVLGYSYSGKGLYREAITHYEESIKQGNNSPSVDIYLGAAYARAGDTQKAEAILAELKAQTKYVSPGELAILYASLGQQDAAFRSLEQAFTEHDIQLKYLKSDCAFDPLRSDPRYNAMMQRVGLPL
jgi:tetratricopeptide (TPR) repeat protein